MKQLHNKDLIIVADQLLCLLAGVCLLKETLAAFDSHECIIGMGSLVYALIIQEICICSPVTSL